METILYTITCIKPTKTTTKGNLYLGISVRKSKPTNDYNGQWTTNWEDCKIKECTSFKIQDDINIIRYLSRKRFKIEPL